MKQTKRIDPFEEHPETDSPKKLRDRTLTLEQVRDVVQKYVISIKAEQAPQWGYNKQYITSVLNGLIIELEDKCLDD